MRLPVAVVADNLADALKGKSDLFAFLNDVLGWPLDRDDPFTYPETEVAGRAAPRASVSRLVRFDAESPFVIFLVDFAADFNRTDLYEILRGIRQRIRQEHEYAGASLEELIFLCTTPERGRPGAYSSLRFVHFEQRMGRTPRMRSFGFERETIEASATLRRVNLPKLELRRREDDDLPNWAACRENWLAAWDIEEVTEDFFKSYKGVFERAEAAITGFADDPAGRKAKRLYTQRLFNRLLFIQFLSRRGWLNFNGRTDYLFALWEGRVRNEDFYQAHLAPLFFAGLNNSASLNLATNNPTLYARIGSVPFLNGGLFDKADDEKVNDAKPEAERIVVPDSVFDGLFNRADGLFACYNFTIAESTPDDIEIAVDPEMLGKVFERLVTKSERQSKGEYYTPRSVVDFMCKEVIKGYMMTALPKPEKVGAIARFVDEADDTAITVAEAKILLPALEAVRVVDPACGSGAYLLGMMQTIFELLRRLDTRADRAKDRDNYLRKLTIIQKNLYGVDLERFAVNIAMLRLWLSLIVDYRDPDVTGLPPLPNLDFKIEVGDSLSAPDPRFAGDIFRDADVREADALAQLKERHFHETGPNKAALAAEILAKEGAMSGRLAQENPALPALPLDAFDWRVRFVEVFQPRLPLADIGGAMNFGGTLAPPPEPGGFHIVIANPPYGGDPVSETLRDRYFPRPRLSAQARAIHAANGNGNGAADDGSMSKDVYGLFLARALELLAPGGQFSYIVSNTWRTIKSFRPLRRRLLTRATIHHILDLPAWIFKATVNTGIVTLTNAPAPPGSRLIAGDLTAIRQGDWATLEANLRMVAAHGVDVQTPTYARYTYLQTDIGTYDNASFFIASPRLYRLMSDKRFTKFSDIGDAVHGISTGDNNKYIRTEAGVSGNLPLIESWMKMSPEEMANLTPDEKTGGVDKDWTALIGCFVPLEKGGEAKASDGWLPNYFVPTQYFINWSKGAIADMRRNPGSAWKNQKYFFKQGLTFSISGVYAPTFRLNSNGVFEAKGSGIFSDKIEPEVLLSILCSRVARYIFKSYIKHSVDTSGDDIMNFRLPAVDEEKKMKLTSAVAAIVEKQKENPRYPYHLHEQR